MTKKIAVIVRDRQAEALRMAVGVILLDDEIDVYVLDRQVEATENNLLYVETITDMEMRAFTNVQENAGMELLSEEEIGSRLLAYDHVIAY